MAHRGGLGAVGLVWILAVSPALAGHDKSDVATTTDGSTYYGEIKSIQYATLNLKTDPAGTLSIEMRYVTGLTSKFDYRIELNHGVRHFGSLGPAQKKGHLSIVTADGPVEVPLTDVFEIVPIEHGFWKRLDGSVNFGLTYTEASASLQYNLTGDANYRTRKNYAALTGSSIFNAQTTGEDTSQGYLRLVVAQAGKKKWGSFELGALSSNPDQGFDLRSVIGGGATKFFIENARRLLALNLGMVYNRENVVSSSDITHSAEALAGFSFQRFKRGSHSPSVQLSVQTFTNVTDTPRFRAVLYFNVSWKIVGDFKMSFQVNNSYDTRPPGTDSENNDVSIVTSVGYTF